jgi:hypothetical protein
MGDVSSNDARHTCAARIVVFVVLAALVLSGCGATHSVAQRHDSLGPETLVPTHACGYLAVGKGWRLNASRSESCDSARHLIRVFFAARKCVAAQRQPGKSCTLEGHDCFELPRQPDTGVVWCVDATRDITATSNP